MKIILILIFAILSAPERENKPIRSTVVLKGEVTWHVFDKKYDQITVKNNGKTVSFLVDHDTKYSFGQKESDLNHAIKTVNGLKYKVRVRYKADKKKLPKGEKYALRVSFLKKE